MNYIIAALICSTVVMGSCQLHKTTSEPKPVAAEANENNAMNAPLPGKLQIKNVIKTGDAVLLQLTVYNNANVVQQFCKWHTPFEPLMSKYLEIKNEEGEEMAYQGPMAKRVMPPPLDSYIKINAKDSILASVDLIKAYAITQPGKYTITYVGQNMSNVVVNENVSFVYEK